MRDSQPFVENRDAGTLAQAIVDTIREPLLVLDKNLRVLAASRSFYSTFQVVPSITQGQLLYELGDGQWDIPALRVLLEKIVPEHGVMEDYEVEHQFPGIGKRTMMLNARKVFYERNSHTTLLLGLKHAFTDDRIDREIAVGFAIAGTNWRLSVVDNGIGAPVGVFAQAKSGLGTSIVNALAQQLEARVDVVSGPQGTSVSVTHATFAKMPDEPGRGFFSPTSTRGHA